MWFARRVLAADVHAAHALLELAHVAAPVVIGRQVRLYPVEGFGGDFGGVNRTGAGGDDADEPLEIRGCIRQLLAQARHDDTIGADAVVEILTEAAGGNCRSPASSGVKSPVSLYVYCDDVDALFARAARLPKVPFTAPDRVISQTTTAALQSGLVYGFAGQVDAIVKRIRRELGAPDAPVIATGGLADLIAPHSETITTVDPELTLQGLRLVWERNHPTAS